MSVDPPDLFTLLGIKLSDLAGGTAGGISAVIAFRRSGLASTLGSVVLGALTSAYMTPWFIQQIGTLGGGASFVVGLCAMAICQFLAGMVDRFITNGKAKGDGQ
jgi:hypothetical protein